MARILALILICASRCAWLIWYFCGFRCFRGWFRTFDTLAFLTDQILFTRTAIGIRRALLHAFFATELSKRAAWHTLARRTSFPGNAIAGVLALYGYITSQRWGIRSSFSNAVCVLAAFAPFATTV